ncbi:MAG: CBS domain-containing protein [Candidatus Binatia bacterium]
MSRDANAVRQGRPGTIESIMTTTVVTMSPEASVAEVIQILGGNGFRHLLVVDGAGRLAGVISDRDVLRCIGRGANPAAARVASIMNRDPIVVRPDTSVKDAIDLLSFHRINCLPVVAGGGTLCGIVTTTDVLAALYDLLGRLEPPKPLPAV